MTTMPTETESPSYLEEDPRPAAPLARRPEQPPAMMPRAEPPPERRPGPSMSANVDDFFGALIDAKMDFPLITKSRTAKVTKGNASYTYRYANLADVMEQIGPIMQKHGLAHVTIPMGNRVYVRVVHRASRQWIEGVLPLALPDHGSDVQRMGSALTYTERYLLCRLLGIVAAEDEDDDGAAQTQGARR